MRIALQYDSDNLLLKVAHSFFRISETIMWNVKMRGNVINELKVIHTT